MTVGDAVPGAARPADVVGGSADKATLGQRIREERLRQSMTLAMLAAQVDLTVSALSQIERGASDPSLASLRRISAALKVPVFHLLSGGPEHELVVRRNRRVKVTFPTREPQYEMVIPDHAGDFTVLALTLEGRSVTSKEPGSHPSEEFVIVTRGRLIVEIAVEHYDLSEGDSVKIDRNLPHRFVNDGDDPAEVIIVLSPAIF
jgi:quercetin dioxygenase-like cupin family protein/DNA-binding XRE family transcriptional regulator